jgi:murE/murF fusion protein
MRCGGVNLSVKLAELLSSIPDEFWVTRPELADELVISGVGHDSRTLQPGELFCGLPGRRSDGAEFAAEACQRGARAVLLEAGAAADHLADAAGRPVPVLRARDARRAMALLSALSCGEPSQALSVVGVTGTDGKTSTVHLTRHLLETAGRRAAAAGTLGISMGAGDAEPWTGAGSEVPAAEPSRHWLPTTPEAPDFQRALSRLRDRGVQDVVCEISSHALDQWRVFGTQFQAVALTHVSTDHIDFHGSREAYLAAKARLFDASTRGGPLEKRPVREVLNIDDAFGRELAGARPACVSYGRAAASHLRLADEHGAPDGRILELVFAELTRQVKAPLLGRFHADNLLAASAIAYALGIGPDEIIQGVATAPPVPGRFEVIRAGQPYHVIVDYAHTAAGLQSLLSAAADLGARPLILVFGCGGDRDTAKRASMGQIAGELADRVFVTTDNPRSEDPARIAGMIADGLRETTAKWEIVLDRTEAFKRAVSAARDGACLVVAGRGAETVQVFADRTVPFDDRQVLRDLLRRRPAGGNPGPSAPDAEHPWSLGAVAEMTGARVVGIAPKDWALLSPLVASGIALDSRAILGGEVFVALRGTRVDGHDFISRAFDAGISAAVAKRSWWNERRAARAKGIHLLVDDPLRAMQRWAGQLRRRVNPGVIAVTGSSGKTTTKEMIVTLLRVAGEVVGTQGNRNNEIGVPWTMLGIRRTTRWAVIEMGTNHPGEIERLSLMAAPDVGVITCIGRAHEGRLGGPEGVLRAKLEMLAGLSSTGTLVVPDDCPPLDEALRDRWSGRIIRFGFSAHADVRGTHVSYHLDHTKLTVAGMAAPITLRHLGEGGVRCALAALATLQALEGVPCEVERLEKVVPLPGRLESLESRGVFWLLDTYNASPESTLCSLEFLKLAAEGGRRVFVFGGMRELGEASAALHARIGSEAGFCDACVIYGEEARGAAAAAQQAGAQQVLWCDEIQKVISFLRSYLQAGDSVLLKGARAAGLERVARALGVIDATYGKGGP